jgi:hypothetical protein
MGRGKPDMEKDSFPCLIGVKPVIVLDLLYSVPKDEMVLIVPKLSITQKWSDIVKARQRRFLLRMVKKLLQESKGAKKGVPYHIEHN